MTTTAKSKAPWKRKNPKAKAGKSKPLTPARKAKAKASARRAGRPYPNMVDNMNAAKTTRKPAARKAESQAE